MPRTSKTPYRPKWAHLHQIDRRMHVGTPAWHNRHPAWKVRKLSAWRRLHMLGSHKQVSRWGRKQGYAPSSSVPLRSMVRTAVSGTLQ